MRGHHMEYCCSPVLCSCNLKYISTYTKGIFTWNDDLHYLCYLLRAALFNSSMGCPYHPPILSGMAQAPQTPIMEHWLQWVFFSGNSISMVNTSRKTYSTTSGWNSNNRPHCEYNKEALTCWHQHSVFCNFNLFWIPLSCSQGSSYSSCGPNTLKHLHYIENERWNSTSYNIITPLHIDSTKCTIQNAIYHRTKLLLCMCVSLYNPHYSIRRIFTCF